MARVKKHSAPRIPRPPNSWILFRAATVQRLHASGQHLRNTQARLSQIIGPMWRAVDDETRLRFEEQAKRSEAEHRAKYPDYKFRPRFKGRKPRAPVFIKDFDKAHRPYCPDASFAPPIPAPPQYLSGPGAPPPSYPDPEYPIVWTLPTTLPENLAYRADSPVRHTPDLESEDDDDSSESYDDLQSDGFEEPLGGDYHDHQIMTNAEQHDRQSVRPLQNTHANLYDPHGHAAFPDILHVDTDGGFVDMADSGFDEKDLLDFQDAWEDHVKGASSLSVMGRDALLCKPLFSYHWAQRAPASMEHTPENV